MGSDTNDILFCFNGCPALAAGQGLPWKYAYMPVTAVLQDIAVDFKVRVFVDAVMVKKLLAGVEAAAVMDPPSFGHSTKARGINPYECVGKLLGAYSQMQPEVVLATLRCCHSIDEHGALHVGGRLLNLIDVSFIH